MIVGYELSMVARAGIRSLMLAARKGDHLVYVGSVGTGFNERTARELREKLDRIKVKKPTVEYERRRKDIVWVRPTLIAEIEYRAWTHDGNLRHSSYKGLRDWQDDATIYVMES